MKVKVSDYIFETLIAAGIKDVFMITGGGAMHLNDSVGRNKQLNYYCFSNEQGAAIAAEGYARVKGSPAVCVVTSGPGGTNCITGVIGQWLDSVPAIYVSGQIKRETLKSSYPHLFLRQLGDQEINIVDIVRPVTKFAVEVREPHRIREYLEKAIFEATHGRPGPVWLDIPLDVQGAMVEREELGAFQPDDDNFVKTNDWLFAQEVELVADLLNKSKRPVIIGGRGVRIANALEAYRELLECTGIPAVTTFNALDNLPENNPQYVGRIGTSGTRSGNFAIQNADLVLCIGTRNNIRQISYNLGDFAKNACKIGVDIDAAELNKPTIRYDYRIHADAGCFLKKLLEYPLENNHGDWLSWCKERQAKYPVVDAGLRDTRQGLHPYYFIEELSRSLSDQAVMVCANGTACIGGYQATIISGNQRVFMNSGCATMGYDLPAVIGAAIALGGRTETYCLSGDGSIQMNIQELQTIAYYNLPVKIFMMNNSGYISIKQTQDTIFGGHRVGCCPKTGVGNPDFVRLSEAYGIPATVIDENSELKTAIAAVRAIAGPVFCEVRVLDEYVFTPKAAAEKLPDGRIISKPLEDMFPYLERAEYQSNIIKDD